MDFSWRTEIGPGLSISHGWGMVINESARIGANVTLFHGATLGRSDRIASNGDRVIGYPAIGDRVWIGPHAVIVGGITIGQDCRIAGGAFVNTNLPDRSLVIGNPMSIINSNCTADVMNQAPVDELGSEC